MSSATRPITPSRGNPKPRRLRRHLMLNSLRAFEAAARHNSFTRAAQELGVTQGAISRHVRALEEYLDFSLFVRTGQGIEIENAARLFALELGEAFSRISRGMDNLIATQAYSVVTVRGYTTLFTRWLIPRLPAFQLTNPDIDVRLVAAAEPVDFDREAVDIAIRYGNGRWPDLQSDLLFQDRMVPVCSLGYLTGRPAGGQDLLDSSRLLHHTLRVSDWPDWFQASGLHGDHAENLYFQDLGIIYECAQAGLGLALGQKEHLKRELESKTLVCPFETVLERERGYYLVCPLERADAPKIRLFRDWLLSTL